MATTSWRLGSECIQLFSVLGMNRSATPLLHQRCPVGGGPSSNMCPWWPPQRTQWYSVRGQINLKSRLVANASGIVVKKLGQPVPLSNFIAEVKSGKPQPAQTNTPGRFSSLSGLVKGRSVPSRRSTSNCGGVRSCFHSASECLSGSVVSTTSAPSTRYSFQFFCNSSTLIVTPASCAARPGRTSAMMKGATARPLSRMRRCMIPPLLLRKCYPCCSASVTQLRYTYPTIVARCKERWYGRKQPARLRWASLQVEERDDIPCYYPISLI